MTIRERLHQEIERIPDESLEAALRLVESLDPGRRRDRIPGRSFFETASAEEFAAAMDRLAAGHEKLPVLAPEVFERESLYEESL
jgi:hypothetical protein